MDDAIFDGCTAILGRIGSGKSYAARGLVETWLRDQKRVCIIDPTDVWYGLRSNAAGDGPGFPVVVFGGEHGDVPIGERSGERVAQIVGERNLPAIVCTAEMSSGERHRFMADFLPTLFRANRVPLHLVVDEADDIAPQQPLPENRRMLGDMERIVRRGRVRGFRVTMITQRAAVLNKNVLSMASTLVAMRMPGPQDRKAIEGWIKGQSAGDQADEVLRSLSGLQIGEGWIWAPEAGVLRRERFPLISTFDSMRTPGVGEEIAEPTGLAAVELGDLRALIEADPTEMPPLTEAQKVTRAELDAAEQRGFERGRLQGFSDATAGLLAQRTEWRERVAALSETIDDFFRGGASTPEVLVATGPAPSPEEWSRANMGKSRVELISDGMITGPMRRILDALAWWEAAGVNEPTRVQVACVARYSGASAAFKNPLATLRTNGRVEFPGTGLVTLTEAGRALASRPSEPATTQALHSMIYDRLTGPQRRILTPVIAAYPAPVSRDDLAARSGYSATSAAFKNPLASLRSLGLVGYPGSGQVIACDILFLGRRPRAVSQKSA